MFLKTKKDLKESALSKDYILLSVKPCIVSARHPSKKDMELFYFCLPMQVETFLQICGEDFNFCSGQLVEECN